MIEIKKYTGEYIVMKKIAVLLTTFAISMPTLAERFYAGTSFERSDYDFPSFSKTNGFSLRAGYEFNEHISVEGSYLKGGESDGGPGWQIEGDVSQAAVKLSTDLSSPVYGYLKIGIGLWDLEADKTNTGQGTESQDGSDLIYGAGLGWNFNGFLQEFAGYPMDFSRSWLDVQWFS